MEDVKKTSPWATGFKWGTIGGIVSVMFGYIMSLNVDWTSFEAIDASRKSPAQYLTYVVLAGVIVAAMFEHRKKDLGGFMSYGRSIGVAMVVSIASGICSAIYVFVFFGIMHPEFQQMIIDQAMAQRQDMSPEQEDQFVSIMKKTTGPGAMAAFTLIGNLFLGLIFGLIGGLFAQKAEQ